MLLLLLLLLLQLQVQKEEAHGMDFRRFSSQTNNRQTSLFSFFSSKRRQTPTSGRAGLFDDLRRHVFFEKKIRNSHLTVWRIRQSRRRALLELPRRADWISIVHFRTRRRRRRRRFRRRGEKVSEPKPVQRDRPRVLIPPRGDETRGKNTNAESSRVRLEVEFRRRQAVGVSLRRRR